MELGTKLSIYKIFHKKNHKIRLKEYLIFWRQTNGQSTTISQIVEELDFSGEILLVCE